MLIQQPPHDILEPRNTHFVVGVLSVISKGSFLPLFPPRSFDNSTITSITPTKPPPMVASRFVSSPFLPLLLFHLEIPGLPLASGYPSSDCGELSLLLKGNPTGDDAVVVVCDLGKSSDDAPELKSVYVEIWRNKLGAPPEIWRRDLCTLATVKVGEDLGCNSKG
jgi:hypothetical protein